MCSLWQDCVTGPHSFIYLFKQTTKGTSAKIQPPLWALRHDRDQNPLPSWSFTSRVSYAMGEVGQIEVWECWYREHDWALKDKDPVLSPIPRMVWS